jgi:hypothetical protein
MKSVFCVAMVLVSVVALGQPAADYQAVIREATEEFREIAPGHWVGRVHVYSRDTYFGAQVDTSLRVELERGSTSFLPEPFTLLRTLKSKEADSESMSLQAATPNQEMELTATRFMFAF